MEGIPRVVNEFLEVEVSTEKDVLNVLEYCQKALHDESFLFDWRGAAFGAEINHFKTRIVAHHIEEDLEPGEALDPKYEHELCTIDFVTILLDWKNVLKARGIKKNS